MNGFMQFSEVAKSECKLLDFARENPGKSMDYKELDKPIPTPFNDPLKDNANGNAKDLGNRLTDGKTDSANEINESDQKLKDYIDDIKAASEFPDTIETDKTADDLKKRSPEECAEKRLEFQKLRDKLIKEWEDKTGQEWPRYDKDVVNENGKVIRKAGDRYDAHHIIPLELGGENTADNVTPISAEKHYDKQGIHSPGSPYDILIKYCKEKGDSE